MPSTEELSTWHLRGVAAVKSKEVKKAVEWRFSVLYPLNIRHLKTFNLFKLEKPHTEYERAQLREFEVYLFVGLETVLFFFI